MIRAWPVSSRSPRRLVEIAAVDADQLADADARGVERLEDRAVPRAQQVRVVRRREQALDLVHVDGLGQALVLPRRANEQHRVGVDEVLLLHPPVERPKGRDLPRHRGRGVLVIVEAGQEPPDDVDVRLEHRARGGGGADRSEDVVTGGAVLAGLDARLESLRFLLLRGTEVQLLPEELAVLAQIDAVAAGGVRAEVPLV
jgi:hypothetical protein